MSVSISEVARPFAEGLAEGELRYQSCADCGAAQTLAHYACQHCGGESLAWRTSEGVGVVYAVTEVKRAPSDEYRALAPYTLVIVELDEGARLMGHATPGVAIGQRVRAGFFEHQDRQLIRFTPI